MCFSMWSLGMWILPRSPVVGTFEGMCISPGCIDSVDEVTGGSIIISVVEPKLTFFFIFPSFGVLNELSCFIGIVSVLVIGSSFTSILLIRDESTVGSAGLF